MIKRALHLYSASFKGLSRETWLLSLIMLINRSGTMVLPFMTLYLTSKEMNRTLSEAGTVVGLWGLGAVIGAYFGGLLTDKIGFHKIQLITLFGGGILFITLGQIHSYSLICVFTFILSMVNEAFRPANSAAVASYSTVETRTRSYSLNRLAVNLGWAIGVSIGGLIASYNYSLLFWIDGITNVIAAFCLLLFIKPMLVSTSVKEHVNSNTITQSAYNDKKFLLFIVLIVSFSFCFFQLFSTIPKYFRDNMHLSESYIGTIMAINGLLIVVTEMVLVNYLEGKKNILIYITFGTLLCAVAFLTLLLPMEAKLLSLAMILFITFGEITAMPFMNTYWSVRATEQNRGQYAALITIAWSAGQTVGPYTCSLIAEKSNFETMFVTLASILSLTAIGFYLLIEKK
ncbi:MAG: MFS transporter [Sphingobacteriaceae bacterium]|jgi:predicted MFS family arabinose efflux permease